jgi:hypothetical protein
MGAKLKSVTLQEGYTSRMKVFQNRVLRGISGLTKDEVTGGAS